MNNENGKEIKVYGTLVNYTVDTDLPADNIHNDALSYAKQSYDDQFGEPVKVNNFQDIINKRIKGITREPGTGTFVNENLYVDGNIYMKDGSGNWVPIDLASILNRLAILESYWKIDSDDKLVPTNPNRQVKAKAFFDTSV